MDTSGDRAKFVRQLYNLRDVLERDMGAEDTRDTTKKINQFLTTIDKYNEKHPMMSFNYKERTTGKRKRGDNDDRGAGGGGGAEDADADAADCMELEAHGYEVEPRNVVDENGYVIMESFSYVRQPLFTYAPR